MTGTDSPVRAASSICRLADSMIRQSAGTSLPASNRTISPTTKSSAWIWLTCPSRITMQTAADMVCKASMACSALFSWYTPKMALSSTTARMMMTSVSPRRR